MQTQSPTFPLPGQGEGLEGRRTARGSYRSAAAVEYQIRLLDRLTSPLRETLSVRGADRFILKLPTRSWIVQCREQCQGGVRRPRPCACVDKIDYEREQISERGQ
jgi:hypothetical protein